jgi:hypothetical protein
MPTTKMAQGHVKPSGEIQIAVRMPKPIFDQLQRIAVESNNSISAQMREFIEAAVKVQADKK